MFESGDVDPLPFVLDDDDSAFGPISSAAPSVSTDSPRGGSSDGGAVGGHHPQSLHRDGHRRGQRDGSFGLGSGRSDAAVGALVRMLQDAAPLHEGGGVGNKGSAASTDGGGAKGGSQGDDSLASSNVRSSDSGGSTTLDGGGGGGDVMTLDWALGQLSGFRDFKESLDESTSTLEAVVEKPNGEEGTEQG